VNEAVRPTGWHPNPEIQKRFDEKLDEEPFFRNKVTEIQKRSQGKKDESKNPTVRVALWTAGSSFYSNRSRLLKDSFLLDSASDSHICNSRERFSNLTPVKEGYSVAGGGGERKIHGFGTVIIRPKGVTPRTDCELTLNDVAYVPDFPVNLVSYDIAMSKGIFWNGEERILVKDGKPICQVERIHNQWLLEYNPVLPSAFATSSESPVLEPPTQESPAAESNEATTEKSTEPESKKPIIRERPVRKSVQTPLSKANFMTWHRRMAHLNWEAISHLPNAAIGVQVEGKREKTAVCEPCQLASGIRQVSRRHHQKETVPFARVYYDLIQMTEAYNGDQWITHFLDEASYTQYAYTHKNKNDTLGCINHFEKYVKKRYKKDVVIIHLDGEKTLGNDFDFWIHEEGMISERTAPDTPDQNGPSERSGGIIVGKARRLRIDAKLPEDLWPECTRAAVYLMNRSPTKTLQWMTPIEMLGKLLEIAVPRPNLFQVKIYGCRSYARILNLPRKRKVAARALIGYLVGYEGTNIFRVWIPQRRKVIRTRDVTFDEDKFYDPRFPFTEETLMEKSPRNQVTVELPFHPYQKLRNIGENESESESESEASESELETELPESSQVAIREVENEEEIDEFFDTPESHLTYDHQLITPEATPDREGIDETHTWEEEIPLQAEEMPVTTVERQPRFEIRGDVSTDNIIEGTRVRRRREAYITELGQPDEYIGYRSAFTAAIQLGKQQRFHRNDLPPPPENWKKLLTHAHCDGFLEAARKEYGDLEKLKCFKKVTRPRDSQIIPVKWVFIYKFDTDGYLMKYKARIVVRGDLQRMTLWDTHAATLSAKTFRALMAIVAIFDLNAEQWDVTNAFVQGQLDEVVYTELPDGFKEAGLCLLLLRPLYGLRRSPRLWQKDLSEKLKDLGLVCILEDMCIFTNDYITVLFFVDDIIPIYHPKNQQKFDEFKEAFKAKYEIRDLGELKWFLGIRILRDRENRKLWLCQDSYVEKITHRFHLEDRKVPVTPMSSEILAKYDGQATPKEVHLYQQKVGSLLYATTITRPDVAKTASKLSEFLLNPSPRHMEAVDRAIAYLYGTRTLAIEYGPDRDQKSEVFTCASDAAFADNEDRKSSDAYLFKLFGGPVDWRAGKQKTVTTSSTEAELLGLTQTAKESYWWIRFFKAIGLDLQHDISVQCDNTQTINAVTKEDGELTTKLKHVDIHRHWLRQEVQARKIHIRWVPTSKMPADGLTKALTRQNHEKFVDMIGLKDIGTEIFRSGRV
jgi:hypothetical protein